MKKTKLLIIIFIIITGSSCTVPLSKLTYIQGVQPGTLYKRGSSPGDYKVRPNDLLYIQVNGQDAPSTDFLNLAGSSASSVGSYTLDLITYVVNESGEITYPKLGIIRVEGLTVDEIRDIVQAGVDKYIENTSVFVRIVERNITILGEVKDPGQKEMVRNQLTIFEALGTAGDVTDYGNRKNIKRLRETKEGTIVASIDLTDPGLISSPDYLILPNDVIYVEPLTKVYGKKTLPYGFGFTLAFATISTILLIFNLLQ
jgi:polysaccharide export outer membrane protein